MGCSEVTIDIDGNEARDGLKTEDGLKGGETCMKAQGCNQDVTVHAAVGVLVSEDTRAHTHTHSHVGTHTAAEAVVSELAAS